MRNEKMTGAKALTEDEFKAEKEALCQLCLTLSYKGFFAATGGNIMLRLNKELVAVTPSATDYFGMTPANICVLRLDDLLQCGGDKSPSVESALHAELLRKRPDIICSIHTHQPVASACALLNTPLTVPERLRTYLGDRIPVAGYAPSVTKLLAKRFAAMITPSVNAYLMANHGIVCCGISMDEALANVERLEQLTRAHLTENIQQRLDAKNAKDSFTEQALLSDILYSIRKENHPDSSGINPA